MKTTNRTFGKLLALALVVLFALTAVVPVLAEPVEQDNLQVVIHNNEGLPAMTEDQFRVYQLFTGSPNKEGGIPEGDVSDAGEWGAENWNNYTLADVEWGASVVGDGYDYSSALLGGLKDASNEWARDDDGNNVFADVKTAEDLARVLEAHKTNAFLQHFAKIVAELYLKPIDGNCTAKNFDDPKDDYLTFAFDKAGYYLFVEADKSEPDEQDATSEYILAVLGDQEINLKASVPTVDKDIVDSANTDKGDVAGVSDYVQFKLTGTLPKNYGDFDTYKYAFHDTLSNGLDLVGPDAEHPLVVRVYADKKAAEADKELKEGTVIKEENGVDDGTNYTVSTGSLEDGCSLEVSFADLKSLKNDGADVDVTKDSIFVVTYYAQVNADAVIGVAGNPNTVDLVFSNDPNHEGTGKTKEKIVYVFAFGLDLTKVASDKLDDGDDNNDGLPGAGFVLKDGDNYAIFKDQYILTVTTTVTEGAESTTTKTQEFFASKEEAEEAQKKAKENEVDGTTVDAVVDGPVRRLTGWTSGTSDPTTTAVKDLIGKYDEAKEAFDDAPNDSRKEGGEAYTALENAKAALEAYLLKSGDGGKIPFVYGLDDGTFTLEEVITPDGYNTMDALSFTISTEYNEDGTLKSVTYASGDKTTTYSNANIPAVFSSGLLPDTLINQKAPFLPFTGGTGTMIFYILGAVLIVGAVTYLVIAAKRRKKAE